MKRIVVFSIVFMLIFSNFAVAKEDFNNNPLNFDEEKYETMFRSSVMHSANMLKKLGIASESHLELGWNNITRRNAFEMLYLAYNGIVGFVGEGDKINFNVKTEADIFADAKPGSYDQQLALNLVMQGLIHGKGLDGDKIILDFDSNITYYEALIAITNIFLPGYLNYENWYNERTVVSEILEDETIKYPRYEIAKLLGLIGENDNIQYSVLTIEEEKMGEYISANEYMHLIYSAMFIPYLYQGDYGINVGREERLIDVFLMRNFNKNMIGNK